MVWQRILGSLKSMVLTAPFLRSPLESGRPRAALHVLLTVQCGAKPMIPTKSHALGLQLVS